MYTLLSFNLHFNLPFIPNIIEISQFFLLIYSANFKKIWHVHDYQKAPVIFSPNLINIQPENVRFLNLSLFQGKLNKKSAALTLEMHASDNPSLQSIDTDPTLICSAFKKNRFYMFTRREPDDVKRLENSCHYSLFGVHVQKPLSKLMKFGFDILQNLQLSLKLASVKVTCKLNMLLLCSMWMSMVMITHGSSSSISPIVSVLIFTVWRDIVIANRAHVHPESQGTSIGEDV